MACPAFATRNIRIGCRRKDPALPFMAPIDGVKPEFDIIASDLETQTPQITDSVTVSQRDPLRFEFNGYSIWLELEQVDSDLDKAIDFVASDLGLVPIPAAHVTGFYGIAHLSEMEAKRRFREQVSQEISSWPPLKAKGLVSDVSYDGVDGEDMDMAWIELTLKTSQEHESLRNTLSSIFFNENDAVKPPEGPWTPHCSMAYDNPEDSPLDLKFAVNLVQQFPTLLTHNERKVKAICLWSNYGKIDKWECLERIDLR